MVTDAGIATDMVRVNRSIIRVPTDQGKIEDFFQSGKSGKNRGFSAIIREKILKSGNVFFKTILIPFNLRKKFFFRL